MKGTIRRHCTLNNNYLDSLGLPKADLDLTKPIITLDTGYTTVIPDRGEITNIIKQLPKETIACYTDGSKTDHGTGYGFLITTNNNTVPTRSIPTRPSLLTTVRFIKPDFQPSQRRRSGSGITLGILLLSLLIAKQGLMR